MRSVFYRSDTRHPTNGAAIFANGFLPRDLASAAPEIRWPDSDDGNPTDNAPDIEPESAVCVTRHFEAAPLFPVGDLRTNSWVYVLDLDVDGMFNTQLAQYNWTEFRGSRGNAAALWPMFGQERAVMQVLPGDIVGAVEVWRRFNSRDDVFQGGYFRPVSYRQNPNYTGALAATAQALINPLVQNVRWITMPMMSQGVVLSTGR